MSEVNMNSLMNKLSERADELKEQHEAEAEAARIRQEHRRVQYPDAYEKMMMEKEMLQDGKPDEPAGMTEDEKREAWRKILKESEKEHIRETGVKVYNEHGIFCGYERK